MVRCSTEKKSWLIIHISGRVQWQPAENSACRCCSTSGTSPWMHERVEQNRGPYAVSAQTRGRWRSRRRTQMIEKLDSIKKQLGELATVLNAFKSEAVQLRVLDFVLGEESPDESGEKPASTRTPRKSRGRRSATQKNADRVGPAKRKKAPSGTGAPATLTQLLPGTFFDKPRTINDMIEHCRHNLARTFKANEFSGKLGRMVRNGELIRKKNADKQYEYKKP